MTIYNGETGQARNVVLGLGNPVLSDDAAGLAVIERLRELLIDHPVSGVDVLASTRAGFELIDMLQGYASAIIVDALDIPDGIPGRVTRLSLQEFAGSARLNSQHEISVCDAFEIAARLGIEMPATITIFGIEAADVRTLKEELSPEVDAAVAPLANQIHYLLKSTAPTIETDNNGVRPEERVFYPPE